MKKIITLFCLIFCFASLGAQPESGVTFFRLSDVKLLESPFLKAQQADLRYILAMSPDRLLAPYLREAGLSPRAESYTNWENSGLDGHIGGHYLSALAMMHASTGETELKDRLDYMIDELERCQNAVGTGFIGGTPGSIRLWSEIRGGDIRAGGFDLNGKWVPLYNIHKTFNGLLDAYLHAGSQKAKNMLIRMTDWMTGITENLSDDQMQDMLRSEHGGLNEVFADVYDITKNEKHLHLARRFSHRFILNPLIAQKDALTGLHANTQIPKVIGFERIADIEGNKDWAAASQFFWQTVTDNRSISIGGNSVREHFHPADDFSSMTESVEGPETCNSYNMLKLTKLLYGRMPETKYMDYYERTLFNHILSSEQPETGGFVYFTPMRPGHYRVYSQPETSFWCCVGSGLENHAKYGEMIYARRNNELLVNLFIPSVLTWKEKGVRLTQTTRFPEDGNVQLIMEQSPRKPFTLSIRNPEWADAHEWTVVVNGKKQRVKAENGYVSLHRRWKKGDKVSFVLPMRLAIDQMPDKSNFYAFRYGPVVLASAAGTEDLRGIYADDSRGGHIAHGKQPALQEMPALIGAPETLVGNLKKDGEETAFVYEGESFPHAAAMKFVPFYKLHNSRYFVYFRQARHADLPALRAEYAAHLKKQSQTTLDLIYPGEQQPESDHGILYENSQTGSLNGKRFRKASGFFAYRLTLAEDASQLQILVRETDRNATAVLMNNRKIDGKPDKSDDGNGFIRLSYSLSLAKGVHEIRFQPDNSPSTAEVFEVRVVK